MKKILLPLAVALLFLFSAASAHDTSPLPDGGMKADTTAAKKTDTSKTAEKAIDSTAKEKKMPEWTTTESGLKWRDKIVGTGSVAKMGSHCNTHYTLWLVDENGEKGNLVQSSKGGNPFPCQVGYKLISGWSEGMVGMKEGGTRELIVPPAIGYGDKAMGNMIPANSTLYFELEFVNEIKK